MLKVKSYNIAFHTLTHYKILISFALYFTILTPSHLLNFAYIK